MSKEKTPKQEPEKLNFEEAKDMTIEEAVRKEAEIKAGVTENDNILDKYIKQNREEVASQKFENTRELTELQKKTIDDFIAEQRKDLEATKALDESELVSTSAPLASEAVSETPEISSASTDLETDKVAASEVSKMDGTIGIGDDHPAQPFYKKKGLWLGVAVALILGGSAIGYGLLQGNKASHSAETTTQTTEATETSQDSSEKDKKNLADFNERYATFFTDKEQTKLKNSEFDKVSELENLLKALEGSQYYDDAKSKFDRLTKSIAAVKAVNEKFESPAIVDGEKVEAVLKAGSNLDDLSSTSLNTGNANLDTLLQAVVAEARSSSATSGGKGGAEPAVNSPSSDKSSAVTESPAPAPASAPSASSVSAASIYGITNYDVNTLQRDLSRVPYNFDVIADSDNPAWTFNEGILEKIVATSQERGYITGNDYILEKVNIVNGNGYYNMFKPDGTYLFSINCKTGYFVGNAKGHSDALDY